MVKSAAKALALAGMALLAMPLLSPAQACNLPPPETGKVASVLDGETLKLADGRIVRLIGAKAPTPPLGWRGEDPWPLVDEAKEAVESLASDRDVELRFGGSRMDRHGYLLAQVFVVAGERRLWLQDELIGRGLARVYSLPTIAPAWPSFSSVSRKREPSGSVCGVLRPIASKMRSTWNA